MCHLAVFWHHLWLPGLQLQSQSSPDVLSGWFPQNLLTFPARAVECWQELSPAGGLSSPLASDILNSDFYSSVCYRAPGLRNGRNSSGCWEAAWAWMSATLSSSQLLGHVLQAPSCSKLRVSRFQSQRHFCTCVFIHHLQSYFAGSCLST